VHTHRVGDDGGDGGPVDAGDEAEDGLAGGDGLLVAQVDAVDADY